jgi:hypothetical protein
VFVDQRLELAKPAGDLFARSVEDVGHRYTSF